MTTHRRRFLRLCGVAGIGAIAGCSSDTDPVDEGGTNTPETENDPANGEGTTTPETENDPVDEQETATPETENNTQLIEASVEDLTLSLTDLPGDEWEVGNQEQRTYQEGDGPIVPKETSSTFRRVNPQGNDEVIIIQTVLSTVSIAKKNYNRASWTTSVGVGEPTDSQELQLGDESEWLAGDELGSDGSGAADLVVMRDTNIFSTIVWTEEAQQGVGMDAITGLAETKVEDWS